MQEGKSSLAPRDTERKPGSVYVQHVCPGDSRSVNGPVGAGDLGSWVRTALRALAEPTYKYAQAAEYDVKYIYSSSDPLAGTAASTLDTAPGGNARTFDASLVQAADPDPVRDFDPEVTDFVFRDMFNSTGQTGPGGIRADLPVALFPAIRTQGITVVRFKLFPCGENLPHTHPRASELLTLLSGGPLQVGFVDTSGVAHINILYPGDVTVFPRGMLHFELNVGTEDAEFLSALNSENPGSLIAAQALFQLPARALSIALNQPVKTLKKINETLYPYDAAVVQMSTRSGCVPGKDIVTEF